MSKHHFWTLLFKEFKESGLSRQAFCKKKAISYNKFQYYWHRGTLRVDNSTFQEEKLSSFEIITIKEERVQEVFSSPLSLVIQLPNQIYPFIY